MYNVILVRLGDKVFNMRHVAMFWLCESDDIFYPGLRFHMADGSETGIRLGSYKDAKEVYKQVNLDIGTVTSYGEDFYGR